MVREFWGRAYRNRLLHWIVKTITTAYQLAGRPLLSAVVAHSTRGVATSLLGRVPLDEMCASVGHRLALMLGAIESILLQSTRSGLPCWVLPPISWRGWRDTATMTALSSVLWYFALVSPCLVHRLIWYCATMLKWFKTVLPNEGYICNHGYMRYWITPILFVSDLRRIEKDTRWE